MASTTPFPLFGAASSTFDAKTSCPLGFSSKSAVNGGERFLGYPGAASFEGRNFGGLPSTFGGFNGSFAPSTLEGRTWGWPSTYGGYPGSFGGLNGFGGFPSTYGSGYLPSELSRFGGYPSEWSRFGGFPAEWSRLGGYPSEWSRFGGYPSEFSRFGGFPSELSRFGGYPSEWSRFGGFPAELEGRFGGNFGGVPGSFGGFGGYNTLGGRFGGENLTLHNVGFRPSHALEYFSLTNPIRVLDHEGNRCLWLCYELKGFKPEECKVTFDKKERAIIVEATHDIKEGKEHHISRKFYRKFVLPDSLAKLDLATIELKSHFSAEGFLYIECTLPKLTAEELARYPSRWAHFNELPFRRNFGGIYENAQPITVKTA